MDYELIKSRRRTIAVQVQGDRVIVRAPMRTTRREADAFVLRHEQWIHEHLEKARTQLAAAEHAGMLTREELDGLYRQAREVLPERVRYYAEKLGVSPGRITVRCQRTRWGSCSTKKNLSFNCLLMLTPPGVIDAVAAHEVCHIKEMNHGRAFYALVRQICPDYDMWNGWLKENGRALLARVPEESRQ
jgi:hypothetical protein